MQVEKTRTSLLSRFWSEAKSTSTIRYRPYDTDRQKRVGNSKINFLIPQPKHVVGTQKNRLNETILLNTQNKCLNWWIRRYSQFYTQCFFFISTYDHTLYVPIPRYQNLSRWFKYFAVHWHCLNARAHKNTCDKMIQYVSAWISLQS